MTTIQKQNESLAGVLYDHYTKSVGGVNFKGEPLPLWEEFRADSAKKLQSDAWVEVARLAREEMAKDKNLVGLIITWAKNRLLNSKGWEKILFGVIAGIAILVLALISQSCSHSYGINYDKESGNVEITVSPNQVTPQK